MKTIKVKKLTKEAFAPYGEVLTIEGREAGGKSGIPSLVSAGSSD